MKNTLRTPWRAEESTAYSRLWDVYDCDGNAIIRDKIEEVARLIAAAPATRELLDAMLEDEQRIMRAITP